jgi:LuxR family transcriptional regulator
MTQGRHLDADLLQLHQLAPEGFLLHLHIRHTQSLLTFQTYSRVWVDHYVDKGYALRDPIIAWGFSTTGSARWDEITVPDPFGILAEAASFGLVHGVAAACGPIKSRTIAACARSDCAFNDAEKGLVFQIVNRLHDLTVPPEILTAAQIAALRLIGAGERHSAAAAKLGISESALKARLIAARTKLDARTTAEAIQRATDLRLM